MTVQQGPWRGGDRPRAVEPFQSFTPADWRGDPPPYDWVVDGCFLRGTVGMLSGDGGLGKSLLMQQLCTAAALGRNWLGLSTERCNTMAVFCEDDRDELWRRQDNINRFYGCGMGDLTPIRYVERAGYENVTMDFDRRTDKPQPTAFFEQVRHAALEHEARILVLDTVADVFGGNEIVKNHVRRFISAWRRVAIEIQGVVILTAHPSVSGMSSGTGISGNTAWNNSVRSRIYLTRAKSEEDDDNPNDRLLKTMKNNQGPFGGKVALRWENGVFIRTDEERSLNIVDRLDDDNRVLLAIDEICGSGTRMSPDRFARTYVCTAVMGHPAVRGMSRGNVEAAKNRLLQTGRLVLVTVRVDRKDRIYVKPASMTLPEEEGKP